jgi:proteic killer suppression protein
LIVSFGSKDTQKIWNREKAKSLPGEIQDVARRELRMLNNSQSVIDLRIPLANRLVQLKGNHNEFYSIRINEEWRIIFRWNKGNAENVVIIDYY